MSAKVSTFSRGIKAAGTTVENEPIVKSDGASSDVMQWLSNNEGSNITISEDDSNNLDLAISGGDFKIQNAGTANLIIDNTYSGGGESGQEWLLMNANSGSDSTLQIKAGISDGAASSGRLVMLMSATGNVGVGVVPNSKLDVFTTSYNNIRIGEDKDNQSTQRGGIIAQPYLTAEQATAGMLMYVDGTGATQDTANLQLGGGHGSYNAVKQISFYTAANATTTTGTERLTIDSAGTLTLGPTDAIINTGTSNGSDNKSIYIDSGSGSSSRGAYLRVFGNQYGVTDGGKLILQTGNTSEAANAGVYIRKNGGVDSVVAPAGGGIYEVGGNLKENVLTNSGFDCWSNSTLCNPTTGAAPVLDDAGDLITDGTFSDTANWPTQNTGWAVTGGQAVATSAASSYAVGQTIAATVVGKLYQVQIVVSGYSAGGIYIHQFDGVSASPTISANGTHTFTCEMLTAFTSFQIRASGTTTLDVDSVTFHEVTPGCVADDDKAMDGGYAKVNTLDCWRQHNDGGTYTKDGSFYSLKTTAGASGNFIYWPTYYNKAEHLQRFAGRTVTLGCWVKTSTASHGRIRLYQEAGGSSSQDYADHTGGGDWEWLEVTLDIDAAVTVFHIQLDMLVNGATAYFSQPMLVFGSAIGAGNYSRPSGEVIWCEKVVPINTSLSAKSTVSATTLNVEAETNGKFPKGALAVHARTYLRDSLSAGSTDGCRLKLYGSTTASYGLDNSVNGLVADSYNYISGTVPCDSNGDIQYAIDTPGTGTSDSSISFYGIQLR